MKACTCVPEPDRLPQGFSQFLNCAVECDSPQAI
jgi:hypothetical protein